MATIFLENLTLNQTNHVPFRREILLSKTAFLCCYWHGLVYKYADISTMINHQSLVSAYYGII